MKKSILLVAMILISISYSVCQTYLPDYEYMKFNYERERNLETYQNVRRNKNFTELVKKSLYIENIACLYWEIKIDNKPICFKFDYNVNNKKEYLIIPLNDSPMRVQDEFKADVKKSSRELLYYYFMTMQTKEVY